MTINWTDEEKDEYRHSVSIAMQSALDNFCNGLATKEKTLAIVDDFDNRSIDERQKRMFTYIRRLIDKIEEVYKSDENESTRI